jgi:hypothetical protein
MKIYYQSFVMKQFQKDLLLILVSIPFICLSAVEPQTLKIADLPSEIVTESHPFFFLQGQLVQARGFWYPTSSQEGILASDSGLKSCCLGSASKLNQQIIVKGHLDYLPTQRVVTLEGIFKIGTFYNHEGQLLQFYALEDAREVKKSNSYVFFLVIGILLILLYLWRLLRKRFDRQKI